MENVRHVLRGISDHFRNTGREHSDATVENGSGQYGSPAAGGSQIDKEIEATIRTSFKKKDLELCMKCLTNNPVKTICYINLNYKLHKFVVKANDNFFKELLKFIEENLGLDELIDMVLTTVDTSKRTVMDVVIAEKDISKCNYLIEKGGLRLLQHKDAKGNTLLHKMVEAKFYLGCEKVTQFANDSGEKRLLSAVNNHCYNPVHIAASKGYRSILNLLLSNRAEWNKKNHHSNTPLHFAAMAGHEECIKILIKRIENDRGDLGQYVNKVNTTKSTAMILAAARSFSNCCALLLSRTDLNLQDKEGNTALHYAAKKGKVSIVESFLNSSADSNIENKEYLTPLLMASKNDRLECLLCLLKIKELNEDNVLNLLWNLVKGKSLECLKYFLSEEKGCDKSINENQTRQKYNELFKSVINGQKQHGETCLHLAVTNRQYEIGLILIAAGANQPPVANVNKEYPLHLAAMIPDVEFTKSNHDKLEKLINVLAKDSHKINNKRTTNGKSYFHLCAESGNTRIIKPLRIRNNYIVGKSQQPALEPFEIAIEKNQNEFLKEIMNVMTKPEKLKTPNEMKRSIKRLVELKNKTGLEIMISQLDILKLTNKELTTVANKALKTACSENNYDVFNYLINRFKRYPSEWEDMQLSQMIHRFFEESLENNRTDVIAAIIQSDWACPAFDTSFCEKSSCDKPCKSLIILNTLYPELSSALMDKMISVNEKQEVHCFILLEQMYYLNDDVNGKDKDEKLKTVDNRTKSHKDKYRQAPFDNNHKLLPEARRYQNFLWTIDHPLAVASKMTHKTILQHKLTKSWLRTKMQYTKYILVYSALWDFLFALFASLFFLQLRNELHVRKYCGLNVTIHDVCSLYNNEYWYENDCFCNLLNHGNSTNKNSIAKMNCSPDNLRSIIGKTKSYEIIIIVMTSISLLILISLLWNARGHLLDLIKQIFELIGLTLNDMVTDERSADEMQCLISNNEQDNVKNAAISQGVETGECSKKVKRSERKKEKRSERRKTEREEKEKQKNKSRISPEKVKNDHVQSLNIKLSDLFYICRSYTNELKFLRLVALMIVWVPVSCGGLGLGLRSILQWQCGIFFTILCWLIFINALNKIPYFQIFVPRTRKIVVKFVIGIIYIVVIISSFAIAFSSLFNHDPTFRHYLTSFVKTMTWMLGDLSYDSSFANSEFPLDYPMQTNFLFVIFVTTIAGYIVYFFSGISFEQIERRMKDSNLHFAVDSLRSQLYYDELVSAVLRFSNLEMKFRRYFTLSQIEHDCEGELNNEKMDNKVFNKKETGGMQDLVISCRDKRIFRIKMSDIKNIESE